MSYRMNRRFGYHCQQRKQAELDRKKRVREEWNRKLIPDIENYHSQILCEPDLVKRHRKLEALRKLTESLEVAFALDEALTQIEKEG